MNRGNCDDCRETLRTTLSYYFVCFNREVEELQRRLETARDEFPTKEFNKKNKENILEVKSEPDKHIDRLIDLTACNSSS